VGSFSTTFWYPPLPAKYIYGDDRENDEENEYNGVNQVDCQGVVVGLL